MSGYVGGCHCGAVRFTVKMDSPRTGLYRCNCSLCRKKGIIMKPVPVADFALLAGAEHLSLYQWNKRIAEHFFCANCGVYTHHRRRRDPSQYSINIECLDDQPMPESASIGWVNGLEHQ